MATPAELIVGSKWVDSSTDVHTIIAIIHGEYITWWDYQGDGAMRGTGNFAASFFKHLKKYAPKQVRYLNIYHGDINPDIHGTVDDADDAALTHRLARIRIEFTEGQFDD